MMTDLPLFAITKWASLLVGTHCPRGRSLLGISIHFSGLAALMSADIARTYDHWSVAILTVPVNIIYSHF